MFEKLSISSTSDSGLIWNTRPSPRSKRRAGDAAGTLDKATGYFKVTVDGKQYGAHRIVFFLHNGYMPKLVDHRDRNRMNNEPDNLQDADHSLNGHNRTGAKGYTAHSSGVGYTVMVRRGLERRNKYVKTVEEAEHYVHKYRVELYGEDLSLLN